MRTLLIAVLFPLLVAAQTPLRLLQTSNDSLTVGKLVKINSSGNAVMATTSDASVPVYCLTESSATFVELASLNFVANCYVDGAGAQAGDFLVASTTTAATLHDAGTSLPSGACVIGQALQTVGANAVLEFQPMSCSATIAANSSGIYSWGVIGAGQASGPGGYLQLGTSGGGSGSADLRAVAPPFAVTIKGFEVTTFSAQPSDGGMICTIQTGTGTSAGTDTAIKITVPASALAQTFTDATDSFSVSPGTWVTSPHCVNSSASASASILNWTLGRQ